jgi:hypothetical protein
MRLGRLLVASLVFVVAAVVGTGVAGLLRGERVQAQESVPVTPGRRVVRPTPGFEVDVMVEGRPLAEYSSRGQTFVEALRGAEYELRIRNPSGSRVAVALFVDGLNTIDASRTSAWDASKWVIGPYETITISGWQMSSERARRFYFTTERDSYAAKRGNTASIGVISAVFFRERRRVITVTPPRPIDREESQSAGMASNAPSAKSESRAPSAKSRSMEDAATGIGRSIHHDVESIDMDLESHPAAEVTIRYDYCNRRCGSTFE